MLNLTKMFAKRTIIGSKSGDPPGRSVPAPFICVQFVVLSLPAFEVVGAETVLLEEVLVFAEKREASISDTALSVTAVDGATLLDAQGLEFSDLNRLAPGVFASGRNVGADIKIRGVGTEAGTSAISGVSIFVDGAIQPFPGTAFTPFYDVDQIEILRGPQGTLFGRAAPAGTINVRHRVPSLETRDFTLNAVAGTADTYNLQVAGGTPVGENFAVRLAGLYDHRDPSRVRQVERGISAESEAEAVRASAVYAPYEDLKFTFLASTLNLDARTPQPLGGPGRDVFAREAFENFNSGASQALDSYVLKADWRLQGLSIQSTTTYQESELIERRDLDANSLDDESQIATVTLDTITQEIRLVNNDPRFWNFIAGVFFSDSDSLAALETDFGADNQQVQNTAVVLPGLTALVGDSNTINAQEEAALFFHNRFDLTDQLSLAAGIRYNDMTFGQSATVFPALVQNGQTIELPSFDLIEQQEDRTTIWSGGLKLRYHIQDQLMIYGSLDRGFRPGGVNFNATPEVALFTEEISNSLEFGLKGEFYGGALRVLLALYEQRYEDFQAVSRDVILEDPGFAGGTRELANLVTNAPEARSGGVELDVEGVVPPWTFRGSFSYNDTEFLDNSDSPCTIDGTPAVCDRTGSAINELPLWSAHLTLERSVPWLGNEFYLRGIGNYRSSARTFDGETLSAFTLADFFVGVRDTQGAWDLGLWVRNLTDEDGQLNRLNGEPAGFFTSQLTRPRHAGVSLTYRY
ncbi:MAG: TonB-dependent receptor [Pseudomonadota bacterium]